MGDWGWDGWREGEGWRDGHFVDWRTFLSSPYPPSPTPLPALPHPTPTPPHTHPAPTFPHLQLVAPFVERFFWCAVCLRVSPPTIVTFLASHMACFSLYTGLTIAVYRAYIIVLFYNSSFAASHRAPARATPPPPYVARILYSARRNM